MNKDVIEKHGEVIKWFCDNTDKGVWVKNTYSDSSWVLSNKPAFHSDLIYVQNDMHAELRKWMADGKIIEFKSISATYGNWHKVNYSSHEIKGIFPYGMERYRVKPEEPEFKVGDWVTIDDHIFPINKITEKNLYWSEFTDCEGFHYEFYGSELTLWEPKRGEWCVFWDNKQRDSYTIRAFNRITDNKQFLDELCLPWDDIAPLEFIETLK